MSLVILLSCKTFELAQKEIGGKLLINTTCAHLGVINDEDILRMADLGVIANYTPA